VIVRPDDLGRDAGMTPVNVDDRVEPGPGRNIGNKIHFAVLRFLRASAT